MDSAGIFAAPSGASTGAHEAQALPASGIDAAIDLFQAEIVPKVIGMDVFDQEGIDKMLEKIRSVTAGEVQAVAKKYFGDDTLTVSVLDPQPIDTTDTKAKRKSGFAVRH